MYVFGGKSDNSVKLNDLWAFNLQSHHWNQVIAVDDELPETRSGHTAVMYDSIMVVFGGIYEVTKELNDVCAYSIHQKRWVSLCEAMGSPVKKNKTFMKDSSPHPRDTGTPVKFDMTTDSQSPVKRLKTANKSSKKALTTRASRRK